MVIIQIRRGPQINFGWGPIKAWAGPGLVTNWNKWATRLIVNEKMEDETDPWNQFAEKHKLRLPVLLRSNSI